MESTVKVSIQHKLKRPIEDDDLYFIVKCNFKVHGFVLQEAEIGWIAKKFDKHKFEEESKTKYISHQELNKLDYFNWKTK